MIDANCDQQTTFVSSFVASFQTFTVPGISERWAAVQKHLHPHLVTLAEAVQSATMRQFPQQWTHYETSFKSQRYINRGHGERSPIDEYHVAFDRVPRGAGILISVSSAEQAVMIGWQLWGVRKAALKHLWSTGQPLWQPLIEHLANQGRIYFRGWHSDPQASNKPIDPTDTWLDSYLESRSSSYLWASFCYPWSALPKNLVDKIVEDVLMLFPLNEALMEQAESYPLLAQKGFKGIAESRAPYIFATHSPSIEAIIEHIQAQGFAFKESIIRSYHIALQTRPLVILPGISGTGKTRLTRLYADAMHHISSSAYDNPYYLIIAVQPDWHSARDLLGYYNSLTGSYQPAPLLRFMLQAAADPQQRYFVCLDEMNLARPEYYLAPLLSALETTEHTIDLGIPGTQASSPTGETIPNPFRIPLNICFTGTVNIDESSYALSDKLLDRANVIELTDVDMATFRRIYQGTIIEPIWQTMCQIHSIVARAGQPFGYRTMSEMLQYIENAQGTFSPEQALDLQIKQKILPRLRGEDTPLLRQTLNDLQALLETTNLRESAEKVQRMIVRLKHDGFTDFYM